MGSQVEERSGAMALTNEHLINVAAVAVDAARLIDKHDETKHVWGSSFTSPSWQKLSSSSQKNRSFDVYIAITIRNMRAPGHIDEVYQS